ncbi:MAG: zinc ribbon domain-containing protein [bacterium]
MRPPYGSKKAEAEEKPCICPYCDASLSKPFPFCQACGKEVRFCSQCGKVLPGQTFVCPHCGAKLK